jgi:hypothetical protein
VRAHATTCDCSALLMALSVSGYLSLRTCSAISPGANASAKSQICTRTCDRPVDAKESVAVVVFKGAKTEDCTYGAELAAQLDARFVVATLQFLTAREAGLPAEHAAGNMGVFAIIFKNSGGGHDFWNSDGLQEVIMLKHSGPIVSFIVREGWGLQDGASAIP